MGGIPQIAMSNNCAEFPDGLKTEQTLAAMNLLDLFPNLQLYMWYVAEGILLFVAALVILLWFIDRTVAIINRIITSLVILGMMILFSMGSLYVYSYTASPTGTNPKVNGTVHVGNSNSWFSFTSPYSLKLNLPALDVNSMVAVGMFLLNVYNILWMRRARCCSTHCHSPTGNAAATAATKTTASTKIKSNPLHIKLVDPVTRSKAKTKTETDSEEGKDSKSDDGTGTSQADKRTAGPPQSDDDGDLAQPFSMKELRLMRQDFTRTEGEGILPWLLRCFDSGAETYDVDEREAKQLGSLARDTGIDRALSSKTGTTTLWDRLLSAVRERYPHKGDIGWRRSRTPTLEKAITYLREIAVREVIYNKDGITDPDDVECDMQMFRKFVQAVPAAHAHIFSFMGCFEGYERPTVREVTVKARQDGDILSDSLYFHTSAIEKMTDRKNKMPNGWGSKLQILPRDNWSRVAAIKKTWQVDYITLPQSRQGKHYVLTMVETSTGWLETYPVPHATARNTILGLEKKILWRHGTPERIESDNGTHFKNSLVTDWAKEHGIEWIYHIPYYAQASGKVERYNGLLKATLKAMGGGTFKNWDKNLAKATWLVNTRGSINRAGPAQSDLLHTTDGDKVPVVCERNLLGKSVWVYPASGKGKPVRGIAFAQGPGHTWCVMMEDGEVQYVPQGNLTLGENP